MDDFLDAMDHPIIFTLLITLAVCGWMAVLTWGAKAMNNPGAAAFFQHP